MMKLLWRRKEAIKSFSEERGKEKAVWEVVEVLEKKLVEHKETFTCRSQALITRYEL